jgi:hypothetical protein
VELTGFLPHHNIKLKLIKTFFNRYGVEIYITAKWDAMQHYMHCCGGNNYQVGYKDYRVTPIGQNFSVPDSCCFEYVEGCGYHIFHKSDVEIANHIYVHGCLTLLKDQVMEGLKQLILRENACSR